MESTVSLKTYEALRQGLALLDLSGRRVLRIRGPEAADLLHRVTSQDTRGMAVGDGAPACIMTGKGKLQFYFELFRLSEDEFVAETEASRVEAMRDTLDRFIFAEQIELEVPEWGCVAVFGTEAAHIAEIGDSAVVARGTGVALRSRELAVEGVRLHGPTGEISVLREGLISGHDLPVGGDDDYEMLRIDAGKPKWGIDADDTTIPLEVNLDSACHADKGCYIGQEIIARIHTYGHVNRKLARLRVDTDQTFETGTLIYDEGVEAGRLTSCYVSPQDGKLRALALLPLVLCEAGQEVCVGAEDGASAVVLD